MQIVEQDGKHFFNCTGHNTTLGSKEGSGSKFPASPYVIEIRLYDDPEHPDKGYYLFVKGEEHLSFFQKNYPGCMLMVLSSLEGSERYDEIKAVQDGFVKVAFIDTSLPINEMLRPKQISGSGFSIQEEDFLEDILTKLNEKMDSLYAIPDNWDSYGAPKPDEEAIEYAREWLCIFAKESWIDYPKASIVGSGDTIFFEYWKGEKKVTIDISKEETFAFRIYGETIEDAEVETSEQRKELWNWLYEKT